MKRKERMKQKLLLILIGISLLLLIIVVKWAVKEPAAVEPGEKITVGDTAILMSFVKGENMPWSSKFGKDAESLLTYGDVEEILDYFSLSDQITYGKEEKNTAVSKENWFQIYDKLLSKIDESQIISYKELMVFGTEESIDGLENGTAYTSEGVLYWKYPLLEQEKYRMLRVVMNGDCILYVREPLKDSFQLSNVLITDSTENSLQVFIDGFYINFESSGLVSGLSNVISDLVLAEGSLKEIHKKEAKISGKILAVKTDSIEIEGYGILPMEENFRVYKDYGKLEQGILKDLLVGYHLTDFVVAEDSLCAGIIVREPEIDTIRVMIKDTNFESNFFEALEFTSDSGYFVTIDDKKEYYKAGELFQIKNAEPNLKGKRIYLEPEIVSGKIQVNSIKRNNKAPAYRGVLEITTEEEGLVLVNELPLEEYLYGVIPSEMPVNYGIEALKAQAVCARSYAYKEIIENFYAQYGAHVDDSTRFQVYNNLEENLPATQAVKDTYGQVAVYNGNVITAYYFSTSCGHTTDGNVWGNEMTEEDYYLAGHTLQTEKEKLDLTEEKVFENFILNKDYPSFDSSISWYRWETELHSKTLEKQINTVLESRKKADPEYILVKNKEGGYVQESFGSIGELKNIRVSHRGVGGIVDAIIIEGTKETIQVIKEYNIRCILAPIGEKLIRKDDSVIESSTLLPSAYFILKPVYQNDRLESLKLYGGGYGHGVGMSQTGAKGMALEGYSYEAILKFFYNGIELSSIYSEKPEES